jgi:competence protein CoiA
VVPDISGRVGQQRLVIEAQASFLSIHQVIKRSATYAKLKIPILWIVPLKGELGGELFRPRLYERYLHSMYFGRVYYWRPGFGASVLPVHFGVAERHIPYAEWYDKDAGEQREAGGYMRTYKVIKRPVPSDRLQIAAHFFARSRPEFRPWNERKTVPSFWIWQDRLQTWWDTKEDEAFFKRFKEDNLPKPRRKRSPFPKDWD